MAKDSTQTRVAGNGTVYVAAYGVTLPSAHDAALPSSFTDLGYINEDGVTFTDEPTIDRKNAWQSFYPVRILETARMAKAAFALEQWNTATLSLAAGGGTVSTAGTGKKFTPHAAGTISEWSIVIDLTDGAITDRFVIPKCMVTSALESQHNRTDLALMPVEVEAIGVNGVDAWLFYSNATTAFT